MASFLAVVTNIIFISLTLDYFQHKAIAFSTSITMIFNFIFLSAVLYRKVEGYDLRYVLQSGFKILLASFLMGLMAYYLYQILGLVMNQSRLVNQIISLLMVMSASVLFYFGLIRYLGIREVDEVLGSFKKRFLKNKL
jgi:putative peptidoglycan lipid II flippase